VSDEPALERSVERRLRAAFEDVRTSVVEHPDLFERVTRSLEDARARRVFRVRIAVGLAAFVGAIAALALALSDTRDGRIVMPWWVIELITNIVLVALAVVLGPFIKRFGRSYAADVFRANPRTGKSYLVLTDIAYYLIFTAFILFTVRFEEAPEWAESRAELLQHELARVGGILLIMGLLHTANVVALPVIGNLLEAGRRRGGGGSTTAPSITTPPLGPGVWTLRIEPVVREPDETGSDERTTPG
jgi:hypothetical protein